MKEERNEVGKEYGMDCSERRKEVRYIPMRNKQWEEGNGKRLSKGNQRGKTQSEEPSGKGSGKVTWRNTARKVREGRNGGRKN